MPKIAAFLFLLFAAQKLNTWNWETFAWYALVVIAFSLWGIGCNHTSNTKELEKKLDELKEVIAAGFLCLENRGKNK